MASNRYNSYRTFLTQKFGTPVLKVSLDAGFFCPNRDGTLGAQGCAFCDNRAFSPPTLNVTCALEQLQATISRNKNRYKAFIAYLQSYSNTYAPLAELKKIYEPLLGLKGVAGLAVGTRPDCFTDDIYSYCKDLNARTFLSMELGLQSAHDGTLQKVRRGHSARDFARCVERLAALGVESVAHVILGLPGETSAMMMETARFCAALPLAGIKIHQLMVIAGTALEQWLTDGDIAPLALTEYAGLVSEFIQYLRPDQYIHRLAADNTEARGLRAPLWSADKAGAMRAIQNYLELHDVNQGDLYER
ncbi:MAG: TIGR01212 family radical SAM protein [Chitinivibrionales bacterium]|nr:TIGR01212 family radical SAM protein [Chitinivibrionales bacterium]